MDKKYDDAMRLRTYMSGLSVNDIWLVLRWLEENRCLNEAGITLRAHIAMLSHTN